MTDDGVGDPAWSPLPWSWAAERLSRSRNLWLVTVCATGRPRALPVWGVWDDDDHRFALSCATGARKARNLEADSRVVVALEDTVECVSVEGRARALEPGERAEMWIARYLAEYRPMAPELDTDFLRSNRLYEMVPERAFGIIERGAEFATRATRWSFDDGR